MSATPPMKNATPLSGRRDKTPELTSNREKRHRDNDEDDRDRHSSRRHRDHNGHGDSYDRERERRERHRRHYEDEDDERRDRKRRHGDEETEAEREERRQRRRERDERDPREYDDRRSTRDYGHRERDRSRESHRSHRSRETDRSRREMSRDEREAERAKRDREMQEERREAARIREERYAHMDRERDMDRRRERPPPSPRRMRSSPPRDLPPPPPEPSEPPPPEDPAAKLIHEVDSEARSVFVSQLAARLTSNDLGLFFEDKLGRGSVRDCRVVMDRVSRRSKGIAYVELDAVELVNKALALSGQVVMGIPISIVLTESEKNRDGVDIASIMAGGRHSQGIPRPAHVQVQHFPPLSTGLHVPPGVDIDANRYASIPYHRLFVSNIPSTLNRDDITQVFEAFGEIAFVDLHYHFNGASKETAYVQFKDLRSAQMAVDAMNGFELAGRNIKVVAFQERSQQVPDQIDDARRGPRMDNNARQQLMFKLARQEPDGSAAPPRGRDAPSRPVVQDPTKYLIVNNMFNPDEETERNWDLDLAEDIKGEVESKYGTVKRIKVDKMSAVKCLQQGDVYIEFETVRFADAAQKGLQGRFFGGRKLVASFTSETIFKAHL